ncbi:hypothetical protein BKA62DRAFT_815152, partial [Auriculariales sp. MPI-PUGE-AT-0066]
MPLGQLQAAALQVQATLRAAPLAPSAPHGVFNAQNAQMLMCDAASEMQRSVQLHLNRALTRREQAMGISQISLCEQHLPLGALLRIAFNLNLVGRIALTQTSRYIRTALLAQPEFWDTVSVTEVENIYECSELWVEHLERTLLRAQSRPIHISVRKALQPSSLSLWRMFADMKLMDRIITLQLAVWVPAIWSLTDSRSSHQTMTAVKSQRSEMWHFLSQPAPLLQTVELVGAAEADEEYLPEHVFDGHAPQLHSLWLKSLVLAPGGHYPALAAITTFNLDGFWNRTLTEQQLRSVLQCMPLIKFLGLEFQTYNPMPGPSKRVDRTNRGLLRVTLSGFMFGLHAIFGLIAGRASFEVNVNTQTYTGDRPFRLCNAKIVGITFGASCTRLHGVSKCPSTGCLRRCTINCQPILRPYTPELPLSTVFPSQDSVKIYSVTIHESQWGILEEHIRAFAHTEELCIILSTCYEHAIGNFSEVFMPTAKNPNFHSLFPSLRRLRLCSGEPFWWPLSQRPTCYAYNLQGESLNPANDCGCRRGCVVSLIDVTCLVARLIPPESRLEELIFSGIEHVAGPDPASELCRLLRMVDSLNATLHPAPSTIVALKEQSIYDGLTRTNMESSLNERFDDFLLRPTSRVMPPSLLEY